MHLRLARLICAVFVIGLPFPTSEAFFKSILEAISQSIQQAQLRACRSPGICRFSQWSYWSPCSCSNGKSYRYRFLTKKTYCEGLGFCKDVKDVKSCCCPTNCVMSTWNPWGSCSRSCGSGTRYRTRTVVRYDTCGGLCLNEKSQWTLCNDGCCPTHCTVTQWGPWSVYCPCGSTTMQHRSRDVASPSSCGGAACPSLSESRRKTCDCCRQDCHWTWGSWDSCSNDCGRGSQRRYTEMVQSPTCGGSACPFNSQMKSCSQYTPRDCQMNAWSLYGACSATCGSGIKQRLRTARVQPYCGGASCPASSEAIACSSGCCPTPCGVSPWGAWGTCSSTCGSGLTYQNRSVTTNPSCGGSSCPSLVQSKPCQRYVRRDCVVTDWSSWSPCSTQCGSGRSTRTRQVTIAAYCGGACPALSESKSCTSYAANRDCKVNPWVLWSPCSEKCTVGLSYRNRTVAQSQNCRGSSCPPLSDSRQCGSANGGCAHNCNGGVCSCNSGYDLNNSDFKTCRPRDCGVPSVTFCPSGMTYGDACKYPTFSCVSGTTYGKTCTVLCPAGYELKNGARLITCEASGAWTTYSGNYCSRINKPPTKVFLSRTSVFENVPPGYVVGTFSSADPNPNDSHTYRLLDSDNGRFKIVNGSSLSITFSPNYEAPQKSFTVTVRSTDSKGLHLDERFAITVRDVNEQPTTVLLSNSYVIENSDKGTVVGSLTTSDPDVGQTHGYHMLDSGGGLFQITSNQIVVAASNSRCRAEGGSLCLLNYEKQDRIVVKIRSEDDGSPPLYKDVSLTIHLRDANDQPRRLDLFPASVLENAPSGTVVGKVSSIDEDSSQTTTYTLIDDDKGRFEIVGDELRKTTTLNYETSSAHVVVVEAKDNGSPALKMTKSFTIEVLDVNEPPMQVNVTDDNGQLKFLDNDPRVEERSPVGTTVGTLKAFDSDKNEKLSFRLDDSSGGMFSLGSVSCKAVANVQGINTVCSAALLVKGNINYEINTFFYVTVRVVDSKGSFSARRFEVDVVDVNDAPHNIKLTSNEIEENLNDEMIGDIVAEDEDPSQSHTCSLVDDARRRFVAKACRLYSTLNANLNFEAKDSYNVTIRVTDDGSPLRSRDQVFAIVVRDVNERPTTITVSNLNIPENSPVGTGFGVLTVLDPDNFGPAGAWQNHSCSAIGNAGGKFVVRNNVIEVADSTLDFETMPTVTIRVRCEDSGVPTLGKDQVFVVVIEDENEVPTNIHMQGGFVKENEARGQLVATFSTNDPDNEVKDRQTFVYILENRVPFAFAGKELRTTDELDFESNSTWKIVVRSTDSGGQHIVQTFQVVVNDTNDPPTQIELVGSGSVPENSGGGTLVGYVQIVDEDVADKHTTSIVAVYRESDNRAASGLFRLNSSSRALTLMSGARLDYENARQYVIEIRTVDSGSPALSLTESITVNITDLNEKPSNVTLDNEKIDENSPNGTVVATIAVSDPDNENENRQTHSCVIMNAFNLPFQVINDLTLIVAGKLNYEQEQNYLIDIRCSDDGIPSLFIDRQFLIEVSNVNEAPTSVGLTNYVINENLDVGATVGIITSSDPDNEVAWVQNVTYVIRGGAAVPFVVSGVNLVTTSKLDFEVRSSYRGTLVATDDGVPPASETKEIVIHVRDVNDRPTKVVLKSKGVYENSPPGTVVGELTTEDEDRGQNHTYALVPIGHVSLILSVIGNNKLVVASGARLDYEKENAYVLVIRTTDSGSTPLSYENDVHVNVLDVNEPPTDIRSDNRNEIAENSLAGTSVANLTVVDPDFNQTHTCRLLNGSEFFVVVQGPTPELRVAQGADIDFEKRSSISVRIQCTDDGRPTPFSVNRLFTFRVSDVNEPVTEILLSGSRRIREDSPVGALVGNLSVVDDDKGQTHDFRTVGFLENAFSIKNERQLVVARPVRLDYESLEHPVINLTVVATDNGRPQLSFHVMFFFTVIDINEAPMNISVGQGAFVPENASLGSLIGRLSVFNPEGNGGISYDVISVNGLANSTDFYLVSNSSGTYLYLNRSLNYDNMSSFALAMSVSDSDDPPISVVLTLDVDVRRMDPCALGVAECDAEHATCIRTSPTTSRCECNRGYAGDGVVCEDIDYCQMTKIDPVSLLASGLNASSLTLCNNGTCVDQIDGYTCKCDAGFSMPDCGVETDECASNPCGVGGSCTDLIDGFDCTCHEGYRGVLCDENIDDCASSPCDSAGTCVDGVATFRCLCSPDYTGDRCSFSLAACDGDSCGDLESSIVEKPWFWGTMIGVVGIIFAGIVIAIYCKRRRKRRGQLAVTGSSSAFANPFYQQDEEFQTGLTGMNNKNCN